MVIERSNLSIIVRHTDERTLELCKFALEGQINKSDFICEVKASPFEENLKNSFDKALEIGNKFTLMVDADTILMNKSINKLYAEAYKSDAFVTQGLVYDYVFAKFRRAGHHLYKTELLMEARKCIPKIGVEKRPENYVINKMRQNGYRLNYKKICVGAHDYEQYLLDLYRKMVNHGYKHKYLIRELIESLDKKKERDYATIILSGFIEGYLENQRFNIDATKDKKIIHSKIAILGLIEKSPIPREEFTKLYEHLSSEVMKNIDQIDFHSENAFSSAFSKMRKYGVLNGLARLAINYLDRNVVNDQKLK